MNEKKPQASHGSEATYADRLRKALGSVEISAQRTIVVPRHAASVRTQVTVTPNKQATIAICRALKDEFGPTEDNAVLRLSSAVSMWMAVLEVAEADDEH